MHSTLHKHAPTHHAPGPIALSLQWLDSKLSRVTSSREFIPEIDGLRFIAIFFVIVFYAVVHIRDLQHRTPILQKWTPDGSFILGLIGNLFLGVQIFFVISGLVVALPFARSAIRGTPKPSLARYFMRRLTRIEPPYILALLAMYYLMHRFRDDLPHLLAGLLYLHRFVFGTANPINQVTWTLEIEVVFYILAPWITLLYRIPGKNLRWSCQLLLLGTDSYFVHNWFLQQAPDNYLSFFAALPFFLAGILLADLYVSGLLTRPDSLPIRLCWDAAAILGLAALLYSHFYGPAWKIAWLSPMAVMLTVAGGIKGSLANRFLRFRPITLVGGMCYSIYLWHEPILSQLNGFAAKLPANLSDLRLAAVYCAIAVPLMIIISMPIYYFTERPFMNGPGSRCIEQVLRSAYASLRAKLIGQKASAHAKS
jgi:peptidoglycan/LPS O-acetylase OafA/YrhL